MRRHGCTANGPRFRPGGVVSVPHCDVGVSPGVLQLDLFRPISYSIASLTTRAKSSTVSTRTLDSTPVRLAERREPLTAQGVRPDQLGAGGRTRCGRHLLLAQANAFTGVVTGAWDTLDLRHAALRRGWHTHPGGGVLHLTHGALGYRCRRAGRWYDEEGDRRRCRDRDRESTGKD